MKKILQSAFSLLMICSSPGISHAQVTDTSARWIWKGGATGSLATAAYPALGVPGPAATNQPGSRLDPVTWTDAGGNLMLFGGFYNLANTYNDLWKYNPTDDTWTWVHGGKGFQSTTANTKGTVVSAPGVMDPGNMPSTRASVVYAVDKDSKLWMFGGLRTQNNMKRNDLWVYDGAINQWAYMNGEPNEGAGNAAASVPGVYGTKGVADAANQPGGRGYTPGAAWIDDNAGKFYMFGGNGYDKAKTNGYLNDFWEYDFASHMWTWIGGSDIYSATANGNYGTKGVAVATNYPQSRGGSTYWKGKDGNFWMFGGATTIGTTTGYLNDLWKFDPSTKMWTWVSGDAAVLGSFGTYGMKGKPDAANKPGGRQLGISWLDANGKLWLFGGYGWAESGVVGTLNDVWRFDPVTNEWTWMFGSKAITPVGSYTHTAGDFPGGRYQSKGWVDGNKDFWFFGGTGQVNTTASNARNDLWKLEAILPPTIDTSAQWTWAGGPNTAASPFVAYPPAKGTPTATANPGTRVDPITWTDTAGKLWLFGGYYNNGNQFNDVWVYDPATMMWTWMNGPTPTPSNGFNNAGTFGTMGVPDAANVPPARSRAAWWVDSVGKLWVFGGRGYTGSANRLNDLWKYDPATNMWTYMNGPKTANQIGNYGTKGVANANNQPGARGYASPISWIDHAAGKLYLFGGYGYAKTSTLGYTDDMWEYNMNTNLWTWTGGSDTLNGVGIYGTQGVEDAANLPPARANTAFWQDKSGNVWMYGGQKSTTGYFNDLWKYNIKTGRWSWIGGSTATTNTNGVYGTRGVPNIANNPGSRTGLNSFLDIDGKLWLYGGYGLPSSGTTLGRMNNLWRYDPVTNMWTWMDGNDAAVGVGIYGTLNTPDPNNIPGGRTEAGTWVDKQGTFWLYGGQGQANTTASGVRGDFWRLGPVLPPTLTQPGLFTSAPRACKGTTGITYTVPAVTGASSYEWIYTGTNVTLSGGATTTAPTNNLDFAANATGGTLRVRAVNGADNGPYRDTVITVNTPPTVTVSPNTAQSICPGGSLTLTASANSLGVDYQWILGTTNVGANSASYSATASGSYTVTVTDKTTLCSGTSSATTITVSTPPTVTISPNTAQSICAGQSLTLTASANSLGVDYQWKNNTTNVGANSASYSATTAGSYTVTVTDRTTGCTGTSSATALTINALPTVSVNATGAQSICAGQSLTLTASANSLGVDYQWKNNTTNAGTNSASYSATTAGSYTVTVTDRGTLCSATSTPPTTLTVNPLPTVSVTPTGAQSICAGDSLTLTATASGVDYQWKEGTTNVGTNGDTYYATTSGSYSVTITDRNTLCTATSTPAVLTENPLPVATLMVTPPAIVCTGDSVLLTAGSGTGYNYQWKNGSAKVGAGGTSYYANTSGDYTVVVTDGGSNCSDSSSVETVIVYSRPVATLTPGDTAFCDGGLVKLEVVSQDTGLSYRWKNGTATIPLASAYFLDIEETGVYTVVVGRSQVAGCEDATNEMTVTVYPLPVADITWDKLLLHATPGYTGYQWNTGGQGIPGATDSTFQPSADGGYSVTITDSNGCRKTSPTFNVTVGIDAVIVAIQIQVFPNPASGIVYIESPVPVNTILSSMDGKLLQQQSNTAQINIGHYANGIYLLQITDSHGMLIKNVKLVKSN